MMRKNLNMKKGLGLTVLILSIILPRFLSASEIELGVTEHKSLVVFLVRHADRDGYRDKITGPGKDRAKELANTLNSENIQYIYSTETDRAQDTAEPTAKRFGLDVKCYYCKGIRTLKTLVSELRNRGGRHLVVGHRGTLRELVKLLRGIPGPSIKPCEFDRLYVVTIGRDGKPHTEIKRYGKLSCQPKQENNSK